MVSLRFLSDCAQTMLVGMPTNLGPFRKNGALPPNHGEKGLLSQPNSSWVASNTGFGLVDSGKATGLPKHAAVIKPGVGTSISVASTQLNDQVILVGMVESEQEIYTLVMEVYHRRDELRPKPSTRIEKINGAESSLICVSPRNGRPNEVVSEGGLEESFMEDTVDDSGHDLRSLGSLGESLPVTILKRKVGVMIKEMDASPIMRNLKLAVEVGNIVGLSCDGKEGMQVDCLKQIVIEKHGKREGSLHSAAQQEVESLVWERGNYSDYEA